MMRRSGEVTAKPQTLRAAIYTRKSSEEGLEQDFNSLHAQREACEAFVLSQAGEGWVALTDLYDDGGFSGGNMERPGLKTLLTDIDDGKIDIVVVYKVDRLTRSLADFAKIVERFDARGASFVSVTQAFNTTTSMGRLTLNVLLSFAQFEREVTGERIRDKIAASKAKGMWMGGGMPLGYDGRDHTLFVNEPEAEQVRHIFRRYLELRSSNALIEELAREGFRSKVTITKSGKKRGGEFLVRGALYHMLQNRTYLGEIVHHDRTYPGLHEAIVPVELFGAVQALLQEKQRRPKRLRDTNSTNLNSAEPGSALLVGLLRDHRGYAMTPTYAKRSGIRYRYYASSIPRSGTVPRMPTIRIPADPIEALVEDRVRKLTGGITYAGTTPTAHDVLLGIVLYPRQLVMRFSSDCLGTKTKNNELTWDRLRTRLERGDILTVEEDAIVITVPAVITRSRGTLVVVSPDRGTPLQKQPVDLTLVRALGRAEAWRIQLLTGADPSFEAIAKRENLPATYVRRITRLAFLAPDLKRAALAGDQPAGLSVDRFMRTDMPSDWAKQRQEFVG